MSAVDGSLPGSIARGAGRVRWAGRFAILTALAAGCVGAPQGRWPFPPTAYGSDSDIVGILDERSRPTTSLVAELSMAIESAEANGVFDAVVQHVDGRGLRITAFRDMIVGTRPIFDLALARGRYDLVLWNDDGPAQRSSGPIEAAASAHGAFLAFTVLGERLFRPAASRPGASVAIERSSDELGLVEILESGPGTADAAPRLARWSLDPLTLGVRSVSITEIDGRVSARVIFHGYREVDGRFFPERFEIRSGADELRIDGVLRDLELDPDPAELDLDLDLDLDASESDESAASPGAPPEDAR